MFASERLLCHKYYISFIPLKKVPNTLFFTSKRIFFPISIPLIFSISTREFERAFGKSNCLGFDLFYIIQMNICNDFETIDN